MPSDLINTIVSQQEEVRNRPLTALLADMSTADLLQSADELEQFRWETENLYHKVRASLFLSVIFRLYLQWRHDVKPVGIVPLDGVRAAMGRDFEKAIATYRTVLSKTGGLNANLFSAMGDVYHRLAFQHLLDQVKLSVSKCHETALLFNIFSLDDYPFTVSDDLITPDPLTGDYPVGKDVCPVRLDPSHSGWSDIFFLAMDYPEGARVVNLSVNLRVHGSNEPILPPCECYCRYIEEPVLDLSSIDLKASRKIFSLEELFNFGSDHLSLLKAGIVASGIVPPSLEDSPIPLHGILQKLLGKPGGIQVVTRVNGIPKGSRLAVSTTLLATIIARLMRFSGQTDGQTGVLSDNERRVVASRAILGEWLGGSGGGWQDSGGLWPGMKIIKGRPAHDGDPEYGVSRGCLLPEHDIFSRDTLPDTVERAIAESMVLVHGGLSQDVGPVLEMVTEKYLLKYEMEWKARQRGMQLFDPIVSALSTGNMKELGRLTTLDWNEAIQPIIPWVNNAFTQDLLSAVAQEFGDDYWGFLMLGGMSGGGMAFIVDPAIREIFKARVAAIMGSLKATHHLSLPFIIEPLVYDFEINHEGAQAVLLTGKEARIPGMDGVTFERESSDDLRETGVDEQVLAEMSGFDRRSHEHMREDLRQGRIGLEQNRLPATARVHDVPMEEVPRYDEQETQAEYVNLGTAALERGHVAVVTFAGGMGSRWTAGAPVVKAINPFVPVQNQYRSFLEIHLAKSAFTSDVCRCPVPHAFTTSYLTHDAIEKYLERFHHFHYDGPLYLSPARAMGRRVYPMVRDLKFLWVEQLEQKLDENAQRVQDDMRRALMSWTKEQGEGEDYEGNDHLMRFNPPGHWHEIPNMIRNGVLARMIRERPRLTYLLCHNIDTLGASLEPALLGRHVMSGAAMTFEVTPRRIEDRGGGLARVNGHMQLIEGMALPREEDEFRLGFYSTLTHWITIDSLLKYFGLDRSMIMEGEQDSKVKNDILNALYEIEKSMPTYVTIKNVKHLWGKGQEDTYPVAQFEKLWGDMTGLKDLSVGYVAVPRYRGLQLKEPSLLDMWLQDGSFAYVEKKCLFTPSAMGQTRSL